MIFNHPPTTHSGGPDGQYQGLKVTYSNCSNGSSQVSCDAACGSGLLLAPLVVPEAVVEKIKIWIGNGRFVAGWCHFFHFHHWWTQA